ncbi:ribosome biogenesis protein SLX9-domain-containing protein [Mrakia frigida]|uniref:FAM207/SLX9 family protein n=1 Tax=Mrakia frigida TaxID=29902 RepID=UPI003FCC1532
MVRSQHATTLSNYKLNSNLFSFSLVQPKSAPFSRRPTTTTSSSSAASHAKAVQLPSRTKPKPPPGLHQQDRDDDKSSTGLQFGELLGQSGEDAIRALASSKPDDADSDEHPQLSKKAKQTLKRNALLSRLNPSFPTTYDHQHTMSSSALRRHKKKEKEKLAGGALTDLGLALAGVAQIEEDLLLAQDEEEGEEEEQGWEFKESKREKKAVVVEKGKIGEGKARGLNAKERSQAVKLESSRLPQILSHPSYAASPWETIRLHAQNTLVTRAAPPTTTTSKKTKGKKPTAGGVGGTSSSGNWGGGGMEVDEM